MIIFGALLAFGIVPSVAAPQGCTQTGTMGRDIMAGGPGHDKLCALGGADYAHADGKGDVILGGQGNDTLVGGGGRDQIKGQQGDDRIFSVDQVEGNDVLRGGRGSDHCYADPGDRIYGCEHVNRGNSPQVVRALSSGFLGVTELGEQAQASASFPACTPPPDEPPDFC